MRSLWIKGKPFRLEENSFLKQNLIAAGQRLLLTVGEHPVEMRSSGFEPMCLSLRGIS
jgi:hypothetical protein